MSYFPKLENIEAHPPRLCDSGKAWQLARDLIRKVNERKIEGEKMNVRRSSFKIGLKSGIPNA